MITTTVIAVPPNVDNRASRALSNSPQRHNHETAYQELYQVGFFWILDGSALMEREGHSFSLVFQKFPCVPYGTEKDGYPTNDSMGFFFWWNFRRHKGALRWVDYYDGLWIYFTHLTFTTHSHSMKTTILEMPSTRSSKLKTRSGHPRHPSPPASTASTACKCATSSVAKNTLAKKTKVDNEMTGKGKREKGKGKREKNGKKTGKKILHIIAHKISCRKTSSKQSTKDAEATTGLPTHLQR